MSIILAIDPGTKNTGYAVFENGKYTVSSALSIKNRQLSWLQRMDFMTLGVLGLWRTYRINVVIIEEPQIFISSAKGRAASNSGAVIKLTALVYSLRALMRERGVKVHLVPVRKWKGSVPKHITQKRIKRHLGLDIADNNESDAVGLGLYFLKS